MAIVIQHLGPRSWKTLRKLRLRALNQEPTAFGHTFEEESLLSAESWKLRCKTWNNGTSSIVVFARSRGESVGMAAGYIDAKNTRRAYLASMWVDLLYRRTGTGTKLVDAVREWSRGTSAEVLFLEVTISNSGALRFYDHLGFQLNGKTEIHPVYPDLQVALMSQQLRNR